MTERVHSEASSLVADDAVRVATFGLGIILPLLAGGNVLVQLDPFPALHAFAVLAAGWGMLVLLRPSGVIPRPPRAALAALAIFLLWWCGSLWLRPGGARASFDTVGLLTASWIYALLVCYRQTGHFDSGW